MTEQHAGGSNWKDLVRNHREEKTETFESARDSPLSETARKDFDGLEFFSISERYRLEGRLERFQESEEVILEATRGPPMSFNHVGQLGVTIEDDLFVLAVYQSPGVDALLVPFRDATNGETTWERGRYLNIETPADETEQQSRPTNVTVDFNLAYHPLSVYDSGVRSAVPPKENAVEAAIRAGEQL